MMSLSDTQEVEELIRDLLHVPYSNGSIAIATENIEINRIRECKTQHEHVSMLGLRLGLHLCRRLLLLQWFSSVRQRSSRLAKACSSGRSR